MRDGKQGASGVSPKPKLGDKKDMGMDLIGVRFETLEDEGATYTAHNPQECRDKVDEDIFNRITQDRETEVITQGHTFAIPIWG